jgi:hypothetical protein
LSWYEREPGEIGVCVSIDVESAKKVGLSCVSVFRFVELGELSLHWLILLGALIRKRERLRGDCGGESSSLPLSSLCLMESTRAEGRGEGSEGVGVSVSVFVVCGVCVFVVCVVCADDGAVRWKGSGSSSMLFLMSMSCFVDIQPMG